jgi:hypothetical protein
MPDMKATLGLDRSAFETGLGMAEKNVAGFASKIGHLMVGAFAIHEVISTFKESIEKLDRVAKLSRVFDVPTETLQRLGGVAQLSGGNIDDVAKALGKMSKAAFTAKQDGGALVAAFDAVGVSLQDLNHMETQELFIKIADGLNKIENPVTRAGIGMQIFGKGFITIAPMIAEGGAAIQKLASTMNIASEEAVMSSEKISDTFKQLQITVQGLMGTFAVAANPIIQFASIGVEQMLTFANSIIMVASAQRELKSVFADSAKDQAELKNRQTDRILMGASDKELKKELEKLTVPPEIPDQFSAQQRELRQKIMSELERRKALKGNRNDDAEDIVGKNVKKTEEDRLKNIENLKTAQEKLTQAIRDRESIQMDSAQKLGRAQAELLQIQSEINMLEDDTVDKIDKKAEAEKKVAEILGLQESSSASILKATEEQAKATERASSLKEKLQTLEAERAGPGAEMRLMEERAKKAASQARETGNIEDAAKAQELANQLQKAKEAEFRAAKFGDSSAGFARQSVNQIVGEIPAAKDFSMIPANSLRDIPSSTEAQRTQPVKLENPPNLQGIMDKLDRLIANAGVFS